MVAEVADPVVGDQVGVAEDHQPASAHAEGKVLWRDDALGGSDEPKHVLGFEIRAALDVDALVVLGAAGPVIGLAPGAWGGGGEHRDLEAAVQGSAGIQGDDPRGSERQGQSVVHQGARDRMFTGEGVNAQIASWRHVVDGVVHHLHVVGGADTPVQEHGVKAVRVPG